MSKIKLHRGYCPTQNKDVEIGIYYVGRPGLKSSEGLIAHMRHGNKCDNAAQGKCTQDECPIYQDAPRTLH